MKNFLFLGLFSLLLCVSAQAQTVSECTEQREYPGTSVEFCEDKQVIVDYKQEYLVEYYRNGYVADTVIGNRICKVSYPPVVRKRLVFVPVYDYVQVCKVEATGTVIRQVYIDCDTAERELQ